MRRERDDAASGAAGLTGHHEQYTLPGVETTINLLNEPFPESEHYPVDRVEVTNL